MSKPDKKGKGKKHRDRDNHPDGATKAEIAEAKRLRKAAHASKIKARDLDEQERQQVEAAMVGALASGVAPA